MSGIRNFGELSSEALLDAVRKAVANADIGLAVTFLGSDGPRNLYLNECAEVLLGRNAQEVETVGFGACVADEERHKIRELYERRMRGEPFSKSYSTVIVRPDGERIPVEIFQSETEVQGRKVNVSFVFDQRDRQRAQLALHESEHRFRHVVENAPDGVVILRGPRIIFLNKRAAALLGLGRPEDGHGRIITEIVHPKEVPKTRERLGAVSRGSPLDPLEYRSRNSDGQEITVEVCSIPVQLDGEPAVVAFARDVTERKAIQAKLAQADRLSALGVLSAGVAHEINNPLAYVLLNLEYLERELGNLPTDVKDLDALLGRVRDARHGAERVASIVRDLRTFARGDEGLRAPVRVTAALESAITIAKRELTARAKIVRSFDEVPPVDGGANRLEQVFLNLLLNAAQAIEPGNPTQNEIRVAVRREDPHVCVQVSDTGSGMSEDIKSRIFEPFFTTKPPGVGTGLGLPICQSIVRALGGDISVVTQLGSGSTFTIMLPIWDGDVAPRTPAPRAAQPDFPRGRVLIVDDEVAVGRTLGLVLASEHEVTVVTCANEALAALETTDADSFDAVLCDLMMPGVTGFELFEMIRKRYPDLAPRVIFMTGGLSGREAGDALNITNPLFEKPFDLDHIRTTLRAMVLARRANLPGAPV